MTRSPSDKLAPDSDALTIAQRDEIRRLYLLVAPKLNEDQRARCRQAMHGTKEQADRTIEWMTDKANSLAAAGA